MKRKSGRFCYARFLFTNNATVINTNAITATDATAAGNSDIEGGLFGVGDGIMLAPVGGDVGTVFSGEGGGSEG